VLSAPRLDPRLTRAIAELDDPTLPIAETRRRIGTLADSLGLPRPSYERVRQLVHLHRRPDQVAFGFDDLVDLAFNTRPADAVIADLLTGKKQGSR